MHNKTTQKFSCGEVTILESNILIFKFKTKEKISLKDLTQARDFRREIIGEVPYYPIIDGTEGFPSFTSEAKSFAAVNKESSDMRIMDILVVNSWTSKMEARLYKSLFKPRNKTLVVMSLEEALIRINEHKVAQSQKQALAG
jgi:hypothetical protein